MALPNVITYFLNTSTSTTFLTAALASTSGSLTLTTTVIGVHQQRITVTSGGDDSTKYFHIIGLNEAGFTVGEFLAGGLGTGVGASASAWERSAPTSTRHSFILEKLRQRSPQH